MTLHPCLTLGVFDSGVGGLSVLQALRSELPHAHCVYLADSGHAPYGERPDAYVLERAQRIAQHLIQSMGCQGLVIACNTATAIAIQQLRTDWPHIPMVGVEPGIKPAVALSQDQRIGVMATSATLRHPRFQRLVQTHAPQAKVLPQACPGLALTIEKGDLHAPEIAHLLARYCTQLRDKHVDTVVLGCTHYAFVQEQIKTLLGPDVRLIDTAQAVAQQAGRLFGTLPCDPAPTAPMASMAPNKGPQTPATVQLQTSGQAQQLHDIALRWLGLNLPVEQIEI